MHHRSNVLKYDAKNARDSLVSAETFGYLINLSGRQRMLSQRVVLNAMLAEMGDATALDCAQKALTLFAESHQILIEGDGHLPGVCFDSLIRKIQQIAKQARMVSVNAQIMATRAGQAGKEFQWCPVC